MKSVRFNVRRKLQTVRANRFIRKTNAVAFVKINIDLAAVIRTKSGTPRSASVNVRTILSVRQGSILTRGLADVTLSVCYEVFNPSSTSLCSPVRLLHSRDKLPGFKNFLCS